jgi:hypothetical protein
MNLKLKIPIANRGYAQSIREIGEILNKIMDQEILDIFDGYVENGMPEDTAAILTLAEVIKAGNGKHTIDVMTEPDSKSKSKSSK